MGSKRIKNINDFKSIKEMNSKLLTPRRVLRILWGVVFVVSCILLYYFQSWFLVNPFKDVLFEDVVDATRLENGDLIVAADSGVGKSIFASDIARGCIRHNRRVCYASVEMPQEEVVNRMISPMSRIP